MEGGAQRRKKPARSKQNATEFRTLSAFCSIAVPKGLIHHNFSPNSHDK
jgi:hypothetical protein